MDTPGFLTSAYVCLKIYIFSDTDWRLDSSLWHAKSHFVKLVKPGVAFLQF